MESLKTIEDVKEFYKQLRAAGQPARLLREGDRLGHWQQIVTIRHGKPLVERLRRYTASQAHAYTVAYDAAEVEVFEQPTFVEEATALQVVYTSTLPRAYHTTQLLFGDAVEVRKDPVFRELERQIPKLAEWISLPLGVWQFISRALYFLGIGSSEIESFVQARERIAQAAGVLEAEAERSGRAVLVAHGFFNYFLGRQLRRRGWQRVQDSGRGYLGVGIYVRKIVT